jgi:putative DNA primase/helicase
MNPPVEKLTAVMDLTSSVSGTTLDLSTGFTLNNIGLWYGKSENDTPVKIAGPFVVLGLARDPKGHGWSILLSWKDRDGRSHRDLVSLADLIGEGADVFRPLLSGDLWIAPKGTKLLKEFFLGLTCDMRVRLVKQAGWYGDAFVLPTHTIGNTAGEQVMFEGKADAAHYGSQGLLEDWRTTVASMCAGNSRAVFACCVAFAGPLNDLLKGEGGGFHFVGSSSVGKTTLLILAGSIHGGGGRAGFVQSWHGTENGFESTARAHSGTALIVDEIGQADGRSIGRTLYMLINGMPKARATRDAELKSQPSWRIMLLSSGELGLADKISEAGGKARAGQLARMVDVPADAGKGYGAFEDTKGLKASAFSEALKNAALRSYGTAGPAFIEGLAADPSAVEKAARVRIGRLRISSSTAFRHQMGRRIGLPLVLLWERQPASWRR